MIFFFNTFIQSTYLEACHENRERVSHLLLKVMNNLLQIREKINKAAKLKQAQILATKNGEVTPYRRSVFKERVKAALKNLEKLDS